MELNVERDGYAIRDAGSIEEFRQGNFVDIGESERDVRVNLAACYRLVALYGMTDLAANHITARVPGCDDHFFINPYGMLYEEVTASSLHKIDLDGNIIERGSPVYGVNIAGYVIHSAIHAARHDLTCVLHTHTRAGVAVASMEEGLLPLSQSALQVYDQVAYHDFEGPVTTDSEKVTLIRDLGDKSVMLLRNHGLIAGGRTIAEAFFNIYILESACRIQVDMLSMGRPICQPTTAALGTTQDFMAGIRPAPRGNLEWAALLRKLDAALPGYEK